MPNLSSISVLSPPGLRSTSRKLVGSTLVTRQPHGVSADSSRRQKSKYDIQHPPHELKDHLKPETFKKAQAYGKDKLTFSIGRTIFDWIVATTMISWGVYPWLWEKTGNLMERFGYGQDYVVSSLHGLQCSP